MSQLEAVTKAKNKAFKVLIETKKKLESACEQARTFIQYNNNDVIDLKEEIRTINEESEAMAMELEMMERSIIETDKIINPSL